MAGHFLLSGSARNFSLSTIEDWTEDDVHKYFTKIRWGVNGTQICPCCGTIDKHYVIKGRRQWRCREIACGHVFSVTSGTKFSDRKLPLKIILKAMILFVTSVKGISASALSRQLGVAYQTGFVLISKLRESILENANKNQLDGLVQIDGAHVSGRLRKPRKKKPSTKRQARDRVPPAANPFHRNRRIVMVAREVDPNGGNGAIRTIVEVVRAESPEAVEALTRKYVKKGAKIWTDEHPAYGALAARYEHESVNHSVEFSSDAGVSNNQAESFFARMRRMTIGQVHRITPKYMADYVTEVAWREDVRKVATAFQLAELIHFTQKKLSMWWTGYWQGHHRSQEILFV